VRAIQYTEYGGPEVLRLVEVPKPQPATGEVRIRTGAIGVNPADHKIRDGMFKDFYEARFPITPGYDVAGVVDAVGEGVDGLAVGDRVVALLTPQTAGAYAEFAVTPQTQVAKIPANLDFATAAALPTPGVTALQMVDEQVQARAGQTVLVTGAAGALGRFAVHILKARGARVVAAVRGGQTETARATGADEVIVLGEQDWSGPPFDHVIDAVGGEAVAKLCRHLAPGGRISLAGAPIDPTGLAAEPAFVIMRPDKAQMAELVAIVARGEFDPPIARRLRLEDAAEAQRLMKAGGLGGKIVLEL